ncbi:MAG: hypothetical protein QNL90_21210 [Gammaproteobacteria bacterium]|nr:hypothetical protein [Gammaproteobacteria bacterium]
MRKKSLNSHRHRAIMEERESRLLFCADSPVLAIAPESLGANSAAPLAAIVQSASPAATRASAPPSRNSPGA